MTRADEGEIQSQSLMSVNLRAAASIRSVKESLLLSEIFTALWNSLIPASKHYSAVVTDRKEAQKPPLLTAVTQDVSCPELWMQGRKTPACILQSVGIPEAPWQSSSALWLSVPADVILSLPSFSCHANTDKEHTSRVETLRVKCCSVHRLFS